MRYCPLCLTEVKKGDTCPSCATVLRPPGGEEGPLGGEPFLEERTGAFYVTEDAGEKLLVWWSWYSQEDAEPKENAGTSDQGIVPVREGVYLGRKYLAWPHNPQNIARMGTKLNLSRLMDFLERLPYGAEFYPFEIVEVDGALRFLHGRLQAIPGNVPGTLFAAPERQLGHPWDDTSADYAKSALLYCALARRYPFGVFGPTDPQASSLVDPDLTLFHALRHEREARASFSEVKKAFSPPHPAKRTLSILGALAGSIALAGFGASLVYILYTYLS